MDWKTYEKLTKDIYERLGQKAGVKIVGWGNDLKVKGHSGVEHQIDVLTSHSDGIHSYLTDIECKYWKEKINVACRASCPRICRAGWPRELAQTLAECRA